jgi:plasmid stabilization system protein ParE
MAGAASALSVRWSTRAQRAFLDTIARISGQDRTTAQLIIGRVEQSIELIAQHPALGTPAALPGVRSYPIPHTGHSIDYRVVGKELRIQRWYRHRQHRK